MTKEELKKEAEEYLKRKLEERKNKLVIELPEVYITDLQQAYLASAESREKQIEIDAEQIRALQKQNGELTDRVKELEAQIEKMKRDVFDCFGREYNVLVAKLLKEWDIKEND